MNNQKQHWLAWLLPTPGNIIFTLVVVIGILWGQSVGAISLGFTNAPASTTTIPYQGHLTDANGNPLNGSYTMAFSLYAQESGGSALWTANRVGANSVQVTNGLFNVMLGSITSLEQSIITGNSTLYLGISIGTNDEMSPRVQLGRVPYAVQAEYALTVPDGSITSEKLSSPLIEHHLATTTEPLWHVPNCEVGSQTEDASWEVVPGLAISFTLSISKTAIVDFSGLGMNRRADNDIYSNISF